MKRLKFIGVLVFSLMVMCWTIGVHAQTECCPAPPACVPTMACPLLLVGGQTMQPSNATIQKLSSAAETVSSMYRSVTKAIASGRRAVVSALGSVKNAIVKAVKWPFRKLGQMLGLVEEEDDKNNVTQDNSHSDDTKVEDRIIKNLTTYADESKSDYASEYFTVQRRKFIRQQATITLMARMLTLKSNLKEIKKLVDEVAGDVEKKEAQSGAGSDGMMSSANDEVVILKSNQQLRLIWFKLLAYQRTIEAIKLEFAANQSISGMKLVKSVPTIQSSGKDGGGQITTSGSK